MYIITIALNIFLKFIMYTMYLMKSNAILRMRKMRLIELSKCKIFDQNYIAFAPPPPPPPHHAQKENKLTRTPLPVFQRDFSMQFI
jgi:hypothetical protein